MKASSTRTNRVGKTLSHPPTAAAPSVEPISELVEAARQGNLIIVIGTGVSLGLTERKHPALSWKGLIEHGFDHAVKVGKITTDQAATFRAHIDSSDIEELLLAADFMVRKLGAPRGDLYGRWLGDVFKAVSPTSKQMQSALRSLVDAQIPICTLNYDSLLEQVTELPTVNLGDTSKVLEWRRRERTGILHLHGSFDAPETCILGTRDYESILRSEVRDLIQRDMSTFSQLLFIGCGGTFTDPNFSELIKWLRANLKGAIPRHYALVTETEVASRSADPAWLGFVEPLSYGATHDELPAFLQKHFGAPKTNSAKIQSSGVNTSDVKAAHRRLLADYRSFLLKDCGQMTIEGLRADMDTTQRRFDIERLFVPLQVRQCRPDISEDDPEGKQKFLSWLEQNRIAKTFAEVFEQHPRLALLALPGGGKTLLLKRLAVAYANPKRRDASTDELPDLDLTPVLIRCREWREYIHLPLTTLLRRIPEITGQNQLDGFNEAILPLFREGRALLLVDGLDEIHDDGRRKTFVTHLEEFLDEYRQTRLVVTSREAGFQLVAPQIARFCERWSVAPLESSAIMRLCEHWYRLMKGDAEFDVMESFFVAQELFTKDSLRRLAENPLLLTMLLVVRHGLGRMPLDRVTLYDRAIEVLLDTWNIEGHERLSIKEAIPQLACIAFEMMRAGIQTATEKELLDWLEEAREKLPQLRRYAQGTPYEFLKRVELRSSLIVESGHQKDGRHTVPFYQFRHLTFQEYLAAKAACDGYYLDYKKGDSILTPLEQYLTMDDWKEVIPMAAALAGKHAEPLVAALVTESQIIRNRSSKKVWPTMEELYERSPATRLLQCINEGVEADSDTLHSALHEICIFGFIQSSPDSLKAICTGPYGQDLVNQAWTIIDSINWPEWSKFHHTYINIVDNRNDDLYLTVPEAETAFTQQLLSDCRQKKAEGLAGCILLASRSFNQIVINNPISRNLAKQIEQQLFNRSQALQMLSAWAWGIVHLHPNTPTPDNNTALNHLLNLYLTSKNRYLQRFSAFALSSYLGNPRQMWQPTINADMRKKLLQITANEESTISESALMTIPGIYTIAFHSRNIWSEEELAARLSALRKRKLLLPFNHNIYISKIEKALQQLGNAGVRHLMAKQQSTRTGHPKHTQSDN